MTGDGITRRAFVVGINGYKVDGFPVLKAAVNDAVAMAEVLRPPVHHEGDSARQDTWFDPTTPRWDVELWSDNTVIPSQFNHDGLQSRARSFFDPSKHDVEGAELLFYFSGHSSRKMGPTELLGPDKGAISFHYLLSWASEAIAAHASTVTIILDCCHSGGFGDRPNMDPFVPNDFAVLPKNCMVLTSASASQPAKEGPDHGHFTEHVLGGLRGAAAGIPGDVTPLSLHSHAATAMRGSGQEPVFKSHSERTPVLVRAKPQVTWDRLDKLTMYFPQDGDNTYPLDWHHEGVGLDNPDAEVRALHDPERDAGYVKRGKHYVPFVTGSPAQHDLDHIKLFRDSNLLRTRDGRDFWFVCTETEPGSSNLVELTPLGRYYRDLVAAKQQADAPEGAEPAEGATA